MMFIDDKLVKSVLRTPLSSFGEKIPKDRRVKNHKLSEGVSPGFYDLATCVRHPKNAHGVSKIDFLRMHHC